MKKFLSFLFVIIFLFSLHIQAEENYDTWLGGVFEYQIPKNWLKKIDSDKNMRYYYKEQIGSTDGGYIYVNIGKFQTNITEDIAKDMVKGMREATSYAYTEENSFMVFHSERDIHFILFNHVLKKDIKEYHIATVLGYIDDKYIVMSYTHTNNGFDLKLLLQQSQELLKRIKLASFYTEHIKKQDWTIKNYVDVFGDKTSKIYLTNKTNFKGTFSNSATTDSLLKIQFLIDQDSCSIMLYEYGSLQVKSSYSNTEYTILIKDENGEKHKLTATNFSDRLKINKADLALFKKLLLENQTLVFYIVELGRYASSDYLFTISLSGYKELYEEFLSE